MRFSPRRRSTGLTRQCALVSRRTPLRSGGALAVVSTHHVAGGDEQFFADAQRCYERWDPATPPGLRLSATEDVPFDRDQFESSGRFGQVAFRRYEHQQTYATSEYRDLLLSYSNHRAMEPAARSGLLACIAQLIDEHYRGQITKCYLNELAVAYKM